MIDLGSVNFHIGIPSLSKDELEAYSSDLFDKWEKHLTETLNLTDFSISLEVEDGSILGEGKIGTTLAKLYVGIALYGSFIGGIQTIKRQAAEGGSYLLEHANAPHEASEGTYETHKKGGNLGQIERLFSKVQRNELTVEEAMQKAEEILGDDSDSSPEFMKELEGSLAETPRMPVQLNIELDEDSEAQPESPIPKPKQNQTPRVKPIPSLHNRIEIWRESKDGKKKIRVTQV